MCIRVFIRRYVLCLLCTAGLTRDLLGDGRIRVLYGIDRVNCVHECWTRTDCYLVIYKLARKECTLVSTYYGVLFLQQTVYEHGLYLYVDSEAGNDHKCNCSSGMVCQSDGSCTFEECSSPVSRMDSIRGSIKGNMRHVGAKMKVECNDDYVRVPDTKTVVCGVNGQWTDFPECVKPCPIEPCRYLPYTHRVSTGGHYHGDARNYTCLDGLYVNDTQRSHNITIVCKDGRWDYTEIGSRLCVNETFYPKHVDAVRVVACSVYEINIMKKTYEGSQSDCRPYGDLVRIETDKKQMHLQGYLNKSRIMSYWAQGMYGGEDWDFSDGARIMLDHWADGRKHNVNGYCLNLYKDGNYEWSSVDCNEGHGYICEFPHY